jgi:3-methylcrotonyl-CoA carboxylase alpha subunit
LIAKVIAHGADRDAAIARLTHALEQTIAAGPRTNIAFLLALCGNEAFRAGAVDTGLIDRNLAELGAAPREIDRAAAARGVARLIERDMARLAVDADEDSVESPWNSADGFQLSGTRVVTVPALVDGDTIAASVSFDAAGITVSVGDTPAAADARVFDGSNEVYVLLRGRQTVVRRRDITEAALEAGDADGVVRAPMHGKVLAVLVEVGTQVHKGQRVAIVEAMKMEHALMSPVDGTVGDVAAKVGEQIAEGAVVLHIETSATEAA